MNVNTLILGSGAAGLAAAVRLRRLGVESLAVYTEGLKMGTSINTGSDKQTYYKLGMYGAEPDSPYQMAKDMTAGGSVHGDIAYIEAAMSPQAFQHLVLMGVPFPHDVYGQHIGYKTDHDPKRRATSCGPYTSRDMCLALIAELERLQIPVYSHRIAVKLLVVDGRAAGAVFVNSDTGELEVVKAENLVFAVGGPGGLYETSVYPKAQTGAIGLALEAGAQACNLAESQYGLASIGFRWNVSGSYMQVLPRFISTDKDGHDEKEYLREYFDSTPAMYDAIFSKGYQWPFAAGHVPGSSLIDIFTYIETVERGRRVWLDYRHDPNDFDFGALSEESRTYLERSGATQESPIQRLQAMNAPAIELYRKNGIDLMKEPLEIAVCAQHNNGGLSASIWWESVNIRHLFPIGEVNGSHGVTRPGGTALNAGQVGALRCSEYIAHAYQCDTLDAAKTEEAAQQAIAALKLRQQQPATLDWRSERAELQHRMSSAGAFIRNEALATAAMKETEAQLARLKTASLGGLTANAMAELLRTEQLCLAQVCYLACIIEQCRHIGSRGGSIVLTPIGDKVHERLANKWRLAPEQKAYRRQMMLCRYASGQAPNISWEECRPIPETDGWFERVWADFREGLFFRA